MALLCERPIRGTECSATGTDAGYQRHVRAKEKACGPCAAAHSARVCLDQKANPTSHRAANQRWRDANRGYFTQRQRERLKDDIGFRVARILRKRLWDAVTRRGSKDLSALALLGCSVDELRSHLEAQFADGMSWENYGRSGWEIDHIRPVSAFNLTDPEQQRACFHYVNLQPLWWRDNRQKGTKDCIVRAAVDQMHDEADATETRRAN